MKKVKKDQTELIFVIDKSGSMYGLEKDTIGGFNSMLAKQKKLEDACRITTVLFDNQYELLHDRIDIQDVDPMTEKDYHAGGSTALLDAVGLTINKIDNVQKHTKGDEKPKVMFVIITDGLENSSVEYTLPQVRKMIKHERKDNGWEFVFLGANMDAVDISAHIGISAKFTADFIPDEEGVEMNFDAVEKMAKSLRENSEMDPGALEEVRTDYRKRGSK